MESHSFFVLLCAVLLSFVPEKSRKQEIIFDIIVEQGVMSVVLQHFLRDLIEKPE